MSPTFLKKACMAFFFTSIIGICPFFPAKGQMRQVYLDADGENAITRLSFYSPNEGYVAFAKWIGYTTDSGRTYAKKYITVNNVNYGQYANINVTFGFDIQGVKAFDKNTLIVYGDYGLVPSILSSTDGGNSFTLVFYSQYDPLQLRTGIKDVVFPQNGATGYAVDADRILKTTDKGMSWTVQAIEPGGYLDHLEAVDENNIIAISTDYTANRILKTSSGGAYWTRVVLPRTEGKVTYAYFLDANMGWLSMYDDRQLHYFYKTLDGGHNWTLQNDVDATPFNCTKMRFTDENTGYALVDLYQVYKTTNSGVRWEPLKRDNDFSYLGYTNNDLQCLSASQVWAGGDRGHLELTTNGGAPIHAAYFKLDTVGLYSTGTVHLVNFSATGYQYQWYVNKVSAGSDYNTTYVHDLSHSVDTVQLIVTDGNVSDTLTKYPQFYTWDIAKVSSYYPRTGSTGTFVTISGTKFSNVSAVLFGGIPAASYNVISDTMITAVVGAGASGTITLKEFYGTIEVGAFNYYPPPAAAPPVIQTVAPLSAPMGSTVTITGSGFNAAASKNFVFFGTLAAKVQSASPGQLVCSVPAGASLAAIHVLNQDNGLSGESPLPFSVTFADSASNFTPNSFTDGFVFNIAYGGEVQGKDIDGDGKPDLIVNLNVGQGDSTAVFLNTTKGGRISFGPRVNIGYRFYPTFGNVALSDLDGDGLPDAVMDQNDRYVKVYRNASRPGAVRFEQEYRIPTGFGALCIVSTDFDNDGRNDIAVGAYSDKCISIARNTSMPGALSFGSTQTFKTSGAVNGIAAGDLDGDGLKDIVAYGNPGGKALALYRNTSTPGNIAFADYVDLQVPGYSQNGSYISIVDFDRDGRLDIVVCNDDNIVVVLNSSTKGHFSFSAPMFMRLEDKAYFTAGSGGCVSNFTGSARPDIIAASGGPFRQIILEKNSSQPGAGKLDSLIYGPGDHSTHILPQEVGGADFDGDGKPDLVASSSDNLVVIYKNTVGVPVVTPLCTSRPYADTLASDIAGASYQWQQDNGGGFHNLADDANISGANKRTLQFVNLPLTWNGYKYRCVVGGLYSSTFLLQLNYTADPGLMVSVTDSAICLGRNVTFTATDSTGYYSHYYFQWQVNGQTTNYYNIQNSFTTNSLHDLDQVRVILSYNDICSASHFDTSRAITMHINGAASSVHISATDSAVCVGTPITFTATPVNPGSLPVYDWKVNNVSQGINDPIFTSSSLRKGSFVYVEMKSSATCAYPASSMSNSINVAPKDTAALSVFVTASTYNICEGTNVTFTASTGNTGPTSSFKWLVNGVNAETNSRTYSTAALQDKDMVQAVVTSPAVCHRLDTASSNIVAMTVNSKVTPAITLSASDAAVCEGNTVVFTAHPANQGSDPLYQWKNNDVSTGDNSPTYTISKLMNNANVTVTLKSNAVCATSATVTSSPLTVTANRIPTVSISGDTSVTFGDHAIFTAFTFYPGPDVIYEWQDSTGTHSWQDISGAAGTTLDYIPVTSGDKIRCICKTQAGCTAIGNALSIRVNKPTAPQMSPNGYRWYPNPVTSTVYIEDQDKSDPLSMISVFSNSGLNVLEVRNTGYREKISIDVSSLGTGEYFVKLARGSGKTSHFVFLKVR